MIRYHSADQQRNVARLQENAALFLPDAPATLSQTANGVIVFGMEVVAGTPTTMFEVDPDGEVRRNRGLTGVEPRL